MLEGTLESFTLPDIFQLLAFTKKTGCLQLDDGSSQGRVYLKDGQVYYAVSSGGRLALGRRLVGAGLVATDQLKQALDDQEEAARDGRGLRVGQILVRNGVVSDETLETFVREQIQDAVFDLMRWSTGAFAFDSGEGSAIEEPIELAVSVENLIMEGSRRLEEWDAVHKKIPSLDAVVAMAPLPGDSGVEVSLQPEEWRLLTLVDGRRTVGELVEVFGQGEFHTCKVLYGLAGAGLLEIRDPAVEGPPSIAALLTQQELLRSLEDDAPASRQDTAGSHAGDGPAVDDTSSPASAAAELELELDPAATRATDDEAEVDVSSAAGSKKDAAKLKAKPAASRAEPTGGKAGAAPDQRLSTDPSIDEDLVQRLIDGVKGL